MYYISLLVFVLLSAVQSLAKDADLYCGACHMLVDEISWEISQTDPKKTIQVGSFRIMPDGTQRLNEIPYKQSGVQLTELLETACSKPADYFQTKGDNPKTKVYKRQNRRDGKPSALKSVTINKDINKMLKFACEGVVEEFEEEIVETFKNKEERNYLKKICVDISDLCTETNLYDVEPDLAPETPDDDDDDNDNEDNQEDNDSERDEEIEKKTEL